MQKTFVPTLVIETAQKRHNDDYIIFMRCIKTRNNLLYRASQSYVRFGNEGL